MTEAASDAVLKILVTTSLADIEADWRVLESRGIESPGQSYDFLRHWMDTIGSARGNQTFVSVRTVRGPVAVMAFQRRKSFGVRILSPLACDHVAVSAPLVDAEYFAGLTSAARSALWKA